MRSFGAKFALYWLPVLIWMLGIFLLSNTTSSTLGEVEEGGRFLPVFLTKILTSQYFVHTLEFGILALLVYRLLNSYKTLSTRLAMFIAMSWAVAYGILDEIHQIFVAGRSSTVSDVGLDSAGAAIALTLVAVLGPHIRSWKSR